MSIQGQGSSGDTFTFHCLCGRQLRASNSMIGKPANCPGCKRQLTVPRPQDVPQDAQPLGFTPKIPVATQPAAKNKKSRAILILSISLVGAFLVAGITVGTMLLVQHGKKRLVTETGDNNSAETNTTKSGNLEDANAAKPDQADYRNHSPAKLNTTETSIGKAEEYVKDSLRCSPDMRHAAWVAQHEQKQTVVIDGVEGKEYDEVGSVTFSPDFKRVAYVATLGEKQFVVVDGIDKEYGTGSPIFSPDSKRVSYTARRNDKEVVVIDGIEGKEYDSVGGLVFSPDSTRVAYSAARGQKCLVVVDGVEGKEYYINEKPWEVSTHVILGMHIAFSPDSKRVAYLTARGEKQLVVVDGDEGTEYDKIDIFSLMFSPDSKHVAYLGKRGEKWFAVVDGVEGKGYDEIAAHIVLPGGFQVGGGPMLTFSPNSARLAYGAERDGRRFAVIDGVEGNEYDRIQDLTFSLDSKHCAYAAKRGDKWLLVVDSAEGKEYDDIGTESLVFSPDSKRLAYVAMRGGKWRIAVNGIEGKEYHEFLEGGRLVFDSPTKFHTLARRGDEIFLVEIEITE